MVRGTETRHDDEPAGSTDSLLSFAEIAHRYPRVSTSAAHAWWADRESNGHPPVAKKIGKALYFDATAYDTWYRATKARPEAPNRTVHPDELVTLSEGARLIGMDPKSVTKYKKRPPAGFPQPVPGAGEPLPSGRTRDKYRAGDFYAYASTRGRHGGGRPTGPSVERRYPYDGDPRLQTARTALENTPAEEHADLAVKLAQTHGGSAGTWANILTTARKHPTP